MTGTDVMHRQRTDADRAAEAAERRDAYLTGLRALEALIGTHADVPLPNLGTDYYPPGDDAAAVAEVRRVAVALGVEPAWTPGGHYIAEKPLGGGVAYRAIAIPGQDAIPADGSAGDDGAAAGAPQELAECHVCGHNAPATEMDSTMMTYRPGSLRGTPRTTCLDTRACVRRALAPGSAA